MNKVIVLNEFFPCGESVTDWRRAASYLALRGAPAGGGVVVSWRNPSIHQSLVTLDVDKMRCWAVNSRQEPAADVCEASRSEHHFPFALQSMERLDSRCAPPTWRTSARPASPFINTPLPSVHASPHTPTQGPNLATWLTVTQRC